MDATYQMVGAAAPLPGRSGAVELTATFLRLFFSKPGWGVGEVLAASGETVRVSGPLGDDPIVGGSYRITGRWEDNKRYGLQVKAAIFLLIPPPGPAGLAAYLAAQVDGIGPVMASRIAEACPGDMAPRDWLSRQPEVPSVPHQLMTLAAAQIERDGAMADAELQARALLENYQFGPRRLASLLAKFGPETPQVLRQTPYRLTEIHGVGWKIADSFAQGRIGIALDDPGRIRAATHHALERSEADGHAGSLPRDLARDVQDLLGIRDAEPLGGEPSLGLIYRPVSLRREESTAASVRALLARGRAVQRPVVTEGLDPSQAAAVALVEGCPLAALTGGPGTGKTTTIRAILACYPTATLTAPTGKAARRMSEQTGRPAATIHRTLGIRPADERDDTDTPSEAELPPGGLVVCDEASMVGLELGARLLEAVVASGSRLLLVGDEGQLPPVGPGGLLRACIDSGIVPIARLTTTHRQAAGSLLDLIGAVGRGDAEACHELARTSDALDVVAMAQREAGGAASVVENVTIRCREAGLNWQVISPTYKGTLGCHSLNERLQKIHAGTAPPTLEEARARYGWRFESAPEFVASDRVVCKENHSAKENEQDKNERGELVMNGQQGRIESIDYERNRMQILWEGVARSYRYTVTDPRIELAYCITCHKAQGSEWPVAIVPMHDSLPRHMLHRSWTYTAISRARQRLVIVGDPRLVGLTAATADPPRHDRLTARIIGDRS